MGGVGQHHFAVVVLDHLESKPALVLGVVAVGDAHRDACLFSLAHHKAAEFIHMGMYDGIAGAFGEHPVQRMGVDEGALLGDEGNAVDHTAQRLDLTFIHAGKGAYKIELHHIAVDAAVQVHDQAFVSAMGQTCHAVKHTHSRHKKHLALRGGKVSGYFRPQ